MLWQTACCGDRTGQVSQCSRSDAGGTCKVVPDERSALETEIARLQDENATLKKEPLARGLPVPLVSGPHHRTYGSVSGGSMDYAVCGAETEAKPNDPKKAFGSAMVSVGA